MLVKFSQVFWAEKAMKQELRDSMEVVLADYYHRQPSASDVNDLATQAYIKRCRKDLDRLEADGLASICLRVGIDQESYHRIKERYYADPRYQTKIYPLLIRYAGDED